MGDELFTSYILSCKENSKKALLNQGQRNEHQKGIEQ
jgi:hypothetical protein